MPDFADPHQQERWLRHEHRDVSAVLAVRATLRALPFLREAENHAEFTSTVVLPVFRAVLTSLTLIRNRPQESRGSARLRSAAYGARGAADAAYVLNAVAADAARGAEFAARAAYSEDAPGLAIRAIQLSANATSASFLSFRFPGLLNAARSMYSAVNSDVDFLEISDGYSERAQRAIELTSQPLWQTDVPGWTVQYWAMLKERLTKEDEDWDFWIRWYEDRLVGRPFDPAMDLAIVQIPDELWLSGARATNAEISRRAAELIKQKKPTRSETNSRTGAARPPTSNAIPPQIARGLLFGGNDDAPIGIVDPPGAGLRDTPDQQQTHADIRQKAEALREHCQGSNRLITLEVLSVRLLQAAGETIFDLRLRAFWAQMNAIRRLADADERLRDAPDPEEPPYLSS
jgi:hypothetical protein